MSNPILTRRELLMTTALIAGATAVPLPALAETVSPAASDGALEAMRCWEEAVNEATAAGEPIIVVEDSDIERGRNVETRYSVSSTRRVNGQALNSFTTVAGQPEVVRAIAVYWVSDSGLITTLEDTWLQGTASSVAHCTYSYTKLDGGQTLAVNYTATLTNYVDFNQAFYFYAEFYEDGSGWMNGGWL